jgi:hypothetical protein
METSALEAIAKDQANLPLVVNLRKDSDTVTKQSREFNFVIDSRNLDMFYFFEDRRSL